jgi:dihydrofolate reductase
MANTVYIATSLDGYIADKHNQVDWLHAISNPEHSDMGYNAHMNRVDALVVGRNTLDLVLSFDCDWPYAKPVFVLSNTMTAVPKGYEDKVFLIKGDLKEIVEDLNQKGFNHLYIDGGITIQNFLKEDLIDEMIITTIPILLGGGIPLFGELAAPLNFRCVKSGQLIDAICQSHFIHERSLT